MVESAQTRLRAFREADADAVLRINAECVPEVGDMDRAKLDLLVEESAQFLVAVDDGEVMGFLIGLDETSDRYESPNYRWFRQRNATLAYVDRIAITADARGSGLGQQFYEHFRSWANEHEKATMAAEVNTEPDNPGSHRFHRRFGFTEVARCRPYGPDEQVAMYEMTLAN